MESRPVGSFCLLVEMVHDMTPAVRAVMASVVVLQADRLVGGVIQYVALCDAFALTPLSEPVPHYAPLYDTERGTITWLPDKRPPTPRVILT